jgi:hypothetical protein
VIVYWNRPTIDTWYALSLDFSKVKDFGVYVIWQRGNPGRVVKVGQGEICDRFSSHKRDRDILQHGNPDLSVTWAVVSGALADGVELYLGDHYKPLVAERFPDVVPIPVNLPGAA